ncbi:PREDICTED: uncharacterized protein LOC107194858 [Dufourea novaeangliae]|uniref:uncharacterized protein LOC107194858 n=1 Tax=Dufourea novaeangliae TaxID=178035 RepID=UPI000767C911|nr:PREDICTED: uncharacterized protein LOC107194858 [Dufourea novaeangliae]
MAIVDPDYKFICVDIGDYVGDEDFVLKPSLMRPFPYTQSRFHLEEEKYNAILCRTRRMVENAFGILAQKWRIFYKPIETKLATTILIVKTACVLHNCLRSKNCDDHFFPHLEPPEPELRAFHNIEHNPRRAARLALATREKFATYFNT